MQSFVFREYYYKKVLSVDGHIFKDYQSLPVEKTDTCNNFACELVASRLIVKNCTSSRTRTYLQKQYHVDAKNYPLLTVVAMVALITSFGAYSGRNGGGGGDKDANKSDAIVSLHLAEDKIQ